MCRAYGDAAPAETATLRYRRSERTSLYIETQEGDVVRLRIKVRESVSGSAQAGAGEAGSEVAVNARAGVMIRFSVEGNLSAEELAAIEDVVTQAAELAGDFFAGDTREAFAAAAALDIDGNTLAHVGLKLSMRERLTYTGTALYQVPQAAAAPPTTATPATEAPASAAPTPVAEAPADEATSPPAAAEPPSAGDTLPAEESPAVPAPSPSVPVAARALATIAEFIGQLLDSLAAPPAVGEGTAGASLDLSLRLRIFQAVVVDVATVSWPATGGDAPAGLALARDTIDALAASQQPLDTHA